MPIAAAWGFAEATLFFIVPDVFLSGVALWCLRRALMACLFALLGALAGGLVMYEWGLLAPESAWRAVQAVPAIYPEMFFRVRQELETQGIWAVLLGPLSGTPYKVYAVQAAASGVGLVLFMLISVPARLIRFMLVTLVVYGVARLLADRTSLRQRLGILLMGWWVFYLGYFWIMN